MEKSPIRDLINQWSPRSALADEIGASVEQVHKWAQFGRIPSEWQYPVMQAAARRGLAGIDAEWMLRTHQREKGAAA